MGDNADRRLDRLFNAARTERPDTSQPETYFETRLLARIAARKTTTPWYSLAWRLVPAFVAITIITIACSIAFSPASSGDMFAALTTGQDERLITSYLAGE